jgi:hypothetical protein
VLGPVSESVSLAGFRGGRERFTFDYGPLPPPSIAATRTNDFVLARDWRFVAGFQGWFFTHMFHLLPSENLARVYTPKREELVELPTTIPPLDSHYTVEVLLSSSRASRMYVL